MLILKVMIHIWESMCLHPTPSFLLCAFDLPAHTPAPPSATLGFLQCLQPALYVFIDKILTRSEMWRGGTLSRIFKPRPA